MTTSSRLRGFSTVLRVLVTVGTLATIVAWTSDADAKKAKKLKMDPSVPETPEPTGPVPPEADANGHVNFGNPQAEGLGRVTVKSESGDKIQVYLDGRYFGDTPVTIYSVPKGDYIIEGTVVSSGKQITKPVSVSENEEATVELGAKPEAAAVATEESRTFTLTGGDALSPKRKTAAVVCLVGAGVGLIAGVAGAILTASAESDFEKTRPLDYPAQDEARSRGERWATVANVGFIMTGLGLVGAGIAAFPMFFRTEGVQSPDSKITALSVTPIFGRGMTGSALSFRF
jgi:hypothetical protein